MKLFEESPPMGRIYLAALLKRGASYGGELPGLRTRLAPQALDPAHLEAYRAACQTRADVPVAYPQLVSTRLHLAMLTQPEFPLRTMGLVHPRFSITQHRPLSLDDRLAFECWFDGAREVQNGVEFDIQTRTFVGDELVWESTAETFYRTRSSSKPPSAPEHPPEGDRHAFVVPADAGRRYARVSGDFNPVHLHPAVSRLFGYKRPIAHGWWLVARSLAELELESPESKTTFEFDFRRPVFLGTDYSLVSNQDDASFAIVDDAGKVRTHGRIGGS